MFDTKKTSIMEVPSTNKVSSNGNNNPFVNAGLKKGAETLSGNGALKYSTTGNDFVDQFGSVGEYLEPRDFSTISKDMAVLYTQNPQVAVQFTLYLRLISRRCKLFDGTKTETVQRGAGLKHEAITRMIWLAVNHKDVFWNNIQIFISCGSWKDVFEMLRTDLMYHGFEKRVLEWDKMANLIVAGLENPDTSNLVKKYLPQITAKSKCNTVRKQANTIIGKYLANKLFGKNSYKDYRKLKSSGEAHQWQQLISQKMFDSIDFDQVHGRALSGLVSSEFLSNHNLESKYTKWIESQPVAKYTGYVHELASKIGSPNMCGYRYGRRPKSLPLYQKMTINKQFDGLVELAKQDVNVQSGLIVVRDTSSSMTGTTKGTNMSAYDIAKALGIFFGSMLEGRFSNSWIEFSNGARMHTYKTNTFVDKWLSDSSEAYGGTNFMAVIDLFGEILNSGVSESDFPTGILCISDGEFNPVQALSKTNIEVALARLRNAGFSKDYVDNFKIILWNVRSGYYTDDSTKFETYGDAENVFYLSGFDGSIISFLLGGNTTSDGSTPKTANELFEAAMNQEILQLVKI